MDIVLCWNVRGLNSTKKQLEVKNYVHKTAAGVIGLLETKVREQNLGKLFQRMFSGWCFKSNPRMNYRGIILIA